MFDPERFLVQLVVIVAATRAVGWIAARFGQPRVVGEITAGLLLGPSLLGRLAPSSPPGSFRPRRFPVLLAVSHLGLLFFMFLVGLHLDLGMLRAPAAPRSSRAPSASWCRSVSASRWRRAIHPRFAPEVSPLAFALFLGLALSVTAFPVLARILEERGLTRTRIGVVAIACAAVDDVSAWCLLAGVTAYVRAAAGGASFARTVLLLAAFAAAALTLLPPVLKRMMSGSPAAFLPVAVLCLLACAAVTEAIGVHALFGAFLAGIAMPRRDDLRRGAGGQPRGRDLGRPAAAVLRLHGPAPRRRLAARGRRLVRFRVDPARRRRRQAGGIDGGGARDGNGLARGGGPRRAPQHARTRRAGDPGAGLELGVLTPPVYAMMVLMALVTTAMATPVLQVLALARR